MKNLLKYLLLLMSATSSGQITLDREVDSLFLSYEFKTVQISPSETKYFFADTLANSFSLYNMDFTPFLTNIVVPEPFAEATTAMQALYISRALFDCDTSNIEYAYYSPTDNNKTFRIMRTDGTLLFQKDSATGPYCLGGCFGLSDAFRPIINTSDGTKLFLQKRNAGYVQLFIYSLCGTLSNDLFELKLKDETYVTVFPNPSSASLTFKINPPDNVNEYELVIFDSNAREVIREKVNSQNHNSIIYASDLSCGTYFYSLCSKSKSYQSGKFIITK